MVNTKWAASLDTLTLCLITPKATIPAWKRLPGGSQWTLGRRRSRCMGHIVNLVDRAAIFDSNVSKFEAKIGGATDEFSFDIWADKGAISRLHNPAT